MSALAKNTLGVAAFVLIGSSAQAACTLGDFTGGWVTYSVSSPQRGAAFAVACGIRVNSDGRFTAECENTAGQTFSGAGRVTLANGSICTFVVKMPQRNDVVATMNLSKETVSGMGTFPGGVLSFSAAKVD